MPALPSLVAGRLGSALHRDEAHHPDGKTMQNANSIGSSSRVTDPERARLPLRRTATGEYRP